MTKTIMITGPKRSGKSALASVLQKKLPGRVSIVNDALVRNFTGAEQGSLDEILDLIEIVDILSRHRVDYVIVEFEGGERDFTDWLCADQIFLTSIGYVRPPADWELAEEVTKWFNLPLEYYDMDEVVSEIIQSDK